MAAEPKARRKAGLTARIRELGRARAREAESHRIVAPFNEIELARLADLAAFMREASKIVDACTDPAAGWKDRVVVERGRALLRWEVRTPYHVLDPLVSDGRRRRRRSPGAMAAILSQPRWQPDDDELLDHAVSYCARVLREPGSAQWLDGFGRALGDLAKRGLVNSARTMQAAREPQDAWRQYIHERMPKPRRGQRFGRTKAIQVVAELTGISSDALKRAVKRASKPRPGAELGTTLAHREHMEERFARLGKQLEADVRAGRKTLPHPGR